MFADLVVGEDVKDLVVLEELRLIEGLQFGHVVEFDGFLELRDDCFEFEHFLVEAGDGVAVVCDLGSGLVELHLEALLHGRLR